MIHILLLAFFGTFIAGCTTITSPVTAYTLTPAPIATSRLLTSQSSLSLKLAGTQAAPSLSTKALLYLSNHQEVGSYLYSRWNDLPSMMIDRVLLAALDDAQLFSALLPKTSTGNTDLLLESTLSSFYHRIHEDKTSDAYIDITYALLDSKTKRTLASKRFIITSPAASMDAPAGVTALTNATHLLSQQCTAWIYVTMKDNKWTK
ncbi:MAG: ABC-type transport auxiliary lipoprotein family protein [Sulfuricurvum sp.]|jgi:cholesterol transport system auxiliary component|nr:ABC-type transport auxiliary lipoprotein family protein [Sulfuricurvum sp.]